MSEDWPARARFWAFHSSKERKLAVSRGESSSLGASAEGVGSATEAGVVELEGGASGAVGVCVVDGVSVLGRPKLRPRCEPGVGVVAAVEVELGSAVSDGETAVGVRDVRRHCCGRQCVM